MTASWLAKATNTAAQEPIHPGVLCWMPFLSQPSNLPRLEIRPQYSGLHSAHSGAWLHSPWLSCTHCGLVHDDNYNWKQIKRLLSSGTWTEQKLKWLNYVWIRTRNKALVNNINTGTCILNLIMTHCGLVHDDNYNWKQLKRLLL